MTVAFRLMMLCVCTLSMFACISTPSTNTPPNGVASITIRLQALTTDKRYSYFELSPNGDLAFGGGYDAINRNAIPVTKLTAEQLFALQSYITQSNLFTAKVSGDQSRKAAANVHHELYLKVDHKGRDLVVNDDQVPAITRLHDMLFGYYAKARYNLPGIGK